MPAVQYYRMNTFLHDTSSTLQPTSQWEAWGDNIALLRRHGYWCCQRCLWLFHIAAKCRKIHDPSVSFTARFNQDWLHLLQGLFPIRQPLRSIKRWLNSFRMPNPPLLSSPLRLTRGFRASCVRVAHLSVRRVIRTGASRSRQEVHMTCRLSSGCVMTPALSH